MSSGPINAPDIHLSIGGLPAVRCYWAERAEGRVPRFDVLSDEHQGITGAMLRDWFESHGLGNAGSGRALRVCVFAVEALA